MYDRAPRIMIQTVGSTGGAVGPGSYNVEVASKTRIRMDAFAPFGSLVERDTRLVDEDAVVGVPGPGYYDGLLPNAASTKQGGVSLGFTAKRFQENIDRVPGPGAYGLPPRARSEPNLKAKSAPALRTSHIKLFRGPLPPSIPVPRQAYGYEENENGILVKQTPSEQETTLGPTTYSVPREEVSRTTKKYKGVCFGKMTSKRSDLYQIDRNIPGPGSYNPLTENKLPRENLNVLHDNSGKQEQPKLIRFTDELLKNEEKQKLPGPGQYKLPRTFDSAGKQTPDQYRAPFGSQCDRFANKLENRPGPGAYNDPRGAMETLKRVTGLKRSPFGQTASRFGRGSSAGPGPAAYIVKEGIGHVTMRKLVMDGTRKGGFGSTAPRGQPLVNMDDLALPGPAEYQPKERPFAPRYHTMSSMFSSMTSRFDQTTGTEQPAPGSYDVAKSFGKLHDHHTPKAPQNEEARKRRFAPGAAAAVRSALARIEEAAPAPNAYDPTTPLPPVSRGVTICKSPRFKSIQSDAPDPGSYTLAPSVRDSVWKPSFNISLGNPSNGTLSVAPGTISKPSTLLAPTKISFLDAQGRSRPSAASAPPMKPSAAQQTPVAS